MIPGDLTGTCDLIGKDYREGIPHVLQDVFLLTPEASIGYPARDAYCASQWGKGCLAEST